MPVRNFEPLNLATDRASTRTFLHETIPVTGTIIGSGTYSDNNIKNYTHGMFQSVYDYPYLSSSANHIFDIAVCYDEASSFSGSSSTQNAKKINMYNQLSQLLLGFTGSQNKVRLFESDLTLDQTGSMYSMFAVTFSRLLLKDQIKKGSFQISLGTGNWSTAFSSNVLLTDASASSNDTGVNNTLGGDYGVLYKSDNTRWGVIFYQAGIVCLTSSIFDGLGAGQFESGSWLSTGRTVEQSMVSSSISGTCDALRHRIGNIQFNNTTEINSTIYFCRVPHNKFNYSANPTYTSGSKIVVKNIASDNPISYITTVGLYSAANELLAVAKLSEPLKKTVDNELTIRVRLDY